MHAEEAAMDRVFEQRLAAEREQAADDAEMEARLKRKETMTQTFREGKERKEGLQKDEARTLERKQFEETQKHYDEQFEETQEEREYMEKMMTKYRHISRDELNDMKNALFAKKRKMQAEVEPDEKRCEWAGGVTKAAAAEHQKDAHDEVTAQELKMAAPQKRETGLLVATNAALDEHVQLDKEAPRSLLIDCSVIFVFDWSDFLSVLLVQTSSRKTSSWKNLIV